MVGYWVVVKHWEMRAMGHKDWKVKRVGCGVGKQIGKKENWRSKAGEDDTSLAWATATLGGHSSK